jgi:hypothetical protein
MACLKVLDSLLQVQMTHLGCPALAVTNNVYDYIIYDQQPLFLPTPLLSLVSEAGYFHSAPN